MSRRRNRWRRSSGTRRGLALAAVLVVGLGLLLIAVGTLHLVRAEVSAIAAGESRVQSRFAARAAARALMAELARERETALAGRPIEAPDSLELFELDGGEAGRLAIARLLPIGPRGARVVPEAGRLDLNAVDADALVATGLVERTEAETLIAARDARPGGRFASVFDLLALEGDAAIGPARVLGPLDDLRILSRVDADEEDVGERIAERLDADLGGGDEALTSVLTVHAFEPDVRFDGSPRIRRSDDETSMPDLDDQTLRLVRAVFGDEDDASATDDPRAGGRPTDPPTGSSTSQAASDPTTPPAAGGGIGPRVAALAAGMPDADPGLAYDAVTRFEGGWRNGLLDINTASASALQGIDGIDAELAAAIVARREAIDDTRRFDRFWPVAEDLVDLADWGEVVDRITTRSTVWRATVAVGIVPADDPEAPLESPIVWELVIDLGAATPRLVEVRDVTMLELIARIEAGRSDADQDFGWDDEGFGDDGLDPAAGDLFGDDPLFQDDPLFEDDPLFSDDPLFDDSPMFDDDPLFGEDPLFDDEPLFDRPSPFEQPANGGDRRDRGGSSFAGPRDRGPGGRWRPATSSR